VVVTHAVVTLIHVPAPNFRRVGGTLRSPTCGVGQLARGKHNERVTPMGLPVAVLTRARRAAAALHALTGVAVDPAELLTGRAALLGLSPHGRISAGGATRLMRSGDGWCALTLSRQDDVDAVPALLESDGVGDDPWPAVQEWVADNACATVTTRARLLGLPVAGAWRNSRRPTADRELGRRESMP
jgi:hypothetical protein